MARFLNRGLIFIWNVLESFSLHTFTFKISLFLVLFEILEDKDENLWRNFGRLTAYTRVPTVTISSRNLLFLSFFQDNVIYTFF